MSDIDRMTSNEIAKEVARLHRLASKGDITPIQTARLEALKSAASRISRATRRDRFAW